MPIDFPTNPTSGQTYSYNSITWEYNGVAWDKQGGGGSVGPQGNTGATGPVGDYVISIRGLTGAVGITNGSGIGLSVSGQTMTFSNTGVLSVNGSTGSVVTYAGTTGNIQFRYNNGVTANGYFTLTDGELSEITDIFTLSGATYSNWYYGNQEAIGLQINRAYSGLGLDESGGVQIKVLGIGDDVGDIYAASLRITTNTNNAGGGSIILDSGGGEQFSVYSSSVYSAAIHSFNGGILSNNAASTNTFVGPIIAAGATFSGLARFTAGISASGATFGFPVVINSAVLGRTSSNYIFGVNAGNSLTTATNNILIGTSAGLGITNQSEIIAIGNGALSNTTKNDSVAIGTRALQSNSGQYAVGIGYEALLNNTSSNVLGIGYGSLRSNAAGNNIGIGPYTLYQNTNASGSANCAIGVNALYANSGGFRNIAIGNDTLIGGAAYTGQSGVENVVIGFQAGYNNKTGSDNVFIGFNAGFGNSSGSSNIYIGSGVCGSTSGIATREIVLGADALGLGSNTAVIGATSQTSATIYGLLNAPGGISAAGGTFTALTRFTAGISASGATIGPSGLYVGGNITTISSGNIESGFNGHFRGLQWIDPFGGRSRIVHNYNAFPHSIDFRIHGASFDASGEINRMQIFASGVSFSQGATFRNSINVTGAVNVSSGISASGGMTLNGTVSLNGQTFTNVVSGINGFTGNIGAPQFPAGQTSTALTVLTFPSGVTSYSTKIPFYQPFQTATSSAPTGSVVANRVYFSLFNTSRQINIHTLRFSAFNTGVTGNCFFGVYSSDQLSGMPRTLLYSSTSTEVGSGFARTSVTNASGLVTVGAGYFYIGVVFNNTPAVYGINSNHLSLYGSGEYTGGYYNSTPFADTSGFTLPTALPATGITFGFIDYVPTGPVRGVLTEYRIV